MSSWRRLPDAKTSHYRRLRFCNNCSDCHERSRSVTTASVLAVAACTDTPQVRRLITAAGPSSPPQPRPPEIQVGICNPAAVVLTTSTTFPWPWSCPCPRPSSANHHRRCRYNRHRRRLRCPTTPPRRCCRRDEGTVHCLPTDIRPRFRVRSKEIF